MWQRGAVIGLVTAAALTVGGESARATSRALPAQAAQAEALQFLQAMIRIDSQDPPGNESQVAEYLRGVLANEGIVAELLEPVPGRASIVARLKGSGRKKPLLLMGHEDVVPVDRPRWSVDPFAGEVRDGKVWGRGASDDKAAVAANLEIFLQLKRQKIPLSRDVIFLAEASEEAGSPAGMDILVQQYWNKIACEFALNEGGSTPINEGKIGYVAVATAEKMPRGIKLKATGSSGHGSVPRLDNAVTHLAAAVAKLGEWQTPARLNDTTREFFSRLSSIAPTEEAEWYRNVLDPAVQAQLRIKKPAYYSMLRTSVVPTMLKAGIKANVIPAEAEATLDVRALPDEDLDKFRAQLATVIDDPQVQVLADEEAHTMPHAPVSSLQNEMFSALEAAQEEVLPDAITVPVMTTGATDSSFLRAKGVAAYGIGIPKTEAESRSVHGNDERIGVEQLGLFVRYLYRAVILVAAS